MRLLALLLLTAAPLSARPTPVLWGELRPGPYAVGWKRVWELDGSRVWTQSAALSAAAGEVRRPIRIDVWYPAAPGGRRVAFGDYVTTSPRDAYLGSANALIRRWDESSYRRFAGDTARYRRMMSAATAATTAAPLPGRRSPLVLYSAGWYNSSPDNAVLAEYLASHGFVVATVAQFNPGLWNNDFTSNDVAVENQTRDLEFALSVVGAWPNVDRRRVVCVGYSTGGVVALLLQGRNPDVDGVVALDPSFIADEWITRIQASPYFGLYRMRVPILVLAAGNPAMGRKSLAALDTLRLADRYLGTVTTAVHRDFGHAAMLEHAFGTPLQEARSGAEGAAAHQAVAGYVLAFLEGVLEGDSAGFAAARASSGRGPAHVDMTYRAGARVPSTGEWIALLGRAGLEGAQARLAELRERYPGLTLVIQREMNAEGYRLLGEGSKAEAVRAFRLNTVVYPASANTWDSLADGYAALGDRAGAREAYQRLLQALPGDTTLPEEVKARMKSNAEAKLGQP